MILDTNYFQGVPNICGVGFAIRLFHLLKIYHSILLHTKMLILKYKLNKFSMTWLCNDLKS